MTKVEKLLNDILCELTAETRDFSLHETFAEHGIDSFLALRLMRGIEDATGRAIEMNVLFDYPTIAQLAQFIDAQDAAHCSDLRAA